MTLRIALDGGHLGRRVGGDSTYIAGLLQGLAAIDHPYRIVVFSPRPESACDLIPRDDRFELRGTGPHLTLLRNSVTLPARTHKNFDVLHVLLYAPPILSTRLVLYIPDVSFLTHPQFFPARVRTRLRWSTLVGVHRAAQVVTCSELSRQLLIAAYRIPPDRVCMAPMGVNHHHFYPRSPDVVAEVRRRLDLPEHYLLYVGNLHPRKNLEGLLNDYATLRRRRADGVPPLVIVGLPWWSSTKLPTLIRSLGLDSVVLPLGWVSDADLPAVMCGATMLIYPSLVEGFGLPPVEAMACGVPTVTLRLSVFPEILGDAAVFASPAAGGLVSAMEALLTRPALVQEKRRAGLVCAARYRWEANAAITLEAYEQVAQKMKKAG
ncbi:MAG: glycosyltransferase family 4 protein [Chloroflexi bacterium]|nr:glycosyltransferase family 4 protein [Chloroflexota bacterium]